MASSPEPPVDGVRPVELDAIALSTTDGLLLAC